MLTPCGAWGSYGGGGGGKGNKGQAKPSIFTAVGGGSPIIPELDPPSRGLGISAWGIVILIVSLFLAGMGFYYFSMCYPAFCLKREKYGIMGSSSVVWCDIKSLICGKIYVYSLFFHCMNSYKMCEFT